MPDATLPTGASRGSWRIRSRLTGWRYAAVLLAAGSSLLLAGGAAVRARGEGGAHSAELDAMIVRAAKRHGVPERLLRRIVVRESNYNPHARNHRYWGLMQISYPTARSMGFKGSPEELLNPLTNLTYAVPYLANAFIAAGKDEGTAVRLYASGYYDTARRHGLLSALRTADSSPVVNVPEPAVAQAGSQPEGGSLFGSLFGTSEQPTAQPQIAAATQAGMVQPVTAAQVDAPAPTASVPSSLRGDTLPQGRPTRGGALLALDRSGRARPPAKWMHDGGLTVLARGEQGDGAFAATRLAAADAGESKRARKNPVFASLDAPGARPASAQAYTASASDESAPPQAAISQVLASPPATEGRLQAVVPAATAAKPAAAPQDADEEAPHRKRRRHARHRAKHDDEDKS